MWPLVIYRVCKGKRMEWIDARLSTRKLLFLVPCDTKGTSKQLIQSFSTKMCSMARLTVWAWIHVWDVSCHVMSGPSPLSTFSLSHKQSTSSARETEKNRQARTRTGKHQIMPGPLWISQRTMIWRLQRGVPAVYEKCQCARTSHSTPKSKM